MIALIIGNILGGLSSLAQGVSVHTKNERQMILVQVIDASIATTSCIVLGGLSGAAANVIAIIRNILKYKGWLSKTATICIVITMFLVFLVTYDSYYSFLPLAASMIYTTALFTCKSYKSLKISLLANILLWLVYSVLIRNYVSALAGGILAVNCLISIYRSCEQFADNNTNKYQKERLKFEIDRIEEI